MFKNLFKSRKKKNCAKSTVTNSYSISINGATSSVYSNAYNSGFGGATSSYYTISKRSLNIKKILDNIKNNKEKNGYII